MKAVPKYRVAGLIVMGTVLAATCSVLVIWLIHEGDDSRMRRERWAVAAEGISGLAASFRSEDSSNDPEVQYLQTQYEIAAQRLNTVPQEATPLVVIATVQVVSPGVTLTIEWIETELAVSGFALGDGTGEAIRFEDAFQWTQEDAEWFSPTALKVTWIPIVSDEVHWTGESRWDPVRVDRDLFGSVTQIKMILDDGTETAWASIYVEREVRALAVTGE